MLVTLRARREVESLRRRALYDKVAEAIGHVRRPDFRVVHYTVQTDHVHLIVEASSTGALSSGMRGFAIRVARAVNRMLGRRGAVWSDRRAVAGVDPCSSAPWFEGYRDQLPRLGVPPPTLPPQTWLLRVGWRRHGLISLAEGPRRGPTRSSGG